MSLNPRVVSTLLLDLLVTRPACEREKDVASSLCLYSIKSSVEFFPAVAPPVDAFISGSLSARDVVRPGDDVGSSVFKLRRGLDIPSLSRGLSVTCKFCPYSCLSSSNFFF